MLRKVNICGETGGFFFQENHSAMWTVLNMFHWWLECDSDDSDATGLNFLQNDGVMVYSAAMLLPVIIGYTSMATSNRVLQVGCKVLHFYPCVAATVAADM